MSDDPDVHKNMEKEPIFTTFMNNTLTRGKLLGEIQRHHQQHLPVIADAHWLQKHEDTGNNPSGGDNYIPDGFHEHLAGESHCHGGGDDLEHDQEDLEEDKNIIDQSDFKNRRRRTYNNKDWSFGLLKQSSPSMK